MIIELKNAVSSDEITKLAEKNKAFSIRYKEKNYLITSSSVKTLSPELESVSDNSWVFNNDLQLASAKFSAKREVKIGNVTIGGETKNTVLIGGPCSVESEAQIRTSAQFIKGLGLSLFRGGCYKPRTSPYSFQGLGLMRLRVQGLGLRLLGLGLRLKGGFS